MIHTDIPRKCDFCLFNFVTEEHGPSFCGTKHFTPQYCGTVQFLSLAAIKANKVIAIAVRVKIKVMLFNPDELLHLLNSGVIFWSFNLML